MSQRERLTIGAIVTVMIAAVISISAMADNGSATRNASSAEDARVRLNEVHFDGRSVGVLASDPMSLNARNDTVPSDAVTLAKGEDPNGRRFRVFTFPTDGRRGIGLKYHGDVETRCCVKRFRGALRPAGFLVGTVIAFASRDVRRSAYFPYQLAPTGKVRGHLYRSRRTALRVWRVVLVFYDLKGMDGDLVAYDADHALIARRYVGLPPACSRPRSPYCFA